MLKRKVRFTVQFAAVCRCSSCSCFSRTYPPHKNVASFFKTCFEELNRNVVSSINNVVANFPSGQPCADGTTRCALFYRSLSGTFLLRAPTSRLRGDRFEPLGGKTVAGARHRPKQIVFFSFLSFSPSLSFLFPRPALPRLPIASRGGRRSRRDVNDDDTCSGDMLMSLPHPTLTPHHQNQHHHLAFFSIYDSTEEGARAQR